MRRVFAAAALLLALGSVGCDEAQVKAGAADAAAAASTSPIPTVALIGSIASAVLAAIGVKKAGVGQRYADGGWSKAEVEELVVALRGHGYTIHGPAPTTPAA